MSSVFESFLATAEMQQAWGEREFVSAMLRFEAALARARSMQDLEPVSKTFGNFKWSSGHSGVLDLNAVEFSAQLMGFIRLRQSERLTPTARALLDAMMTDAITGLRSHVVKIDYTNIFVMKAWGLIALGEALGRPDVADDGYRRFDAWMAWTAKHGIGEYGAVVYYGIDLDSLALIARFAGRAEARAQAERAIRYVWTDLAANWWAPDPRAYTPVICRRPWRVRPRPCRFTSRSSAKRA